MIGNKNERLGKVDAMASNGDMPAFSKGGKWQA